MSGTRQRSDLIETLCNVISRSGRFGEPLGCGYRKGHRGPHSWATLPTFVNGEPVRGNESGDDG